MQTPTRIMYGICSFSPAFLFHIHLFPAASFALVYFHLLQLLSHKKSSPWKPYAFKKINGLQVTKCFTALKHLFLSSNSSISDPYSTAAVFHINLRIRILSCVTKVVLIDWSNTNPPKEVWFTRLNWTLHHII